MRWSRIKHEVSCVGPMCLAVAWIALALTVGCAAESAQSAEPSSPQSRMEKPEVEVTEKYRAFAKQIIGSIDVEKVKNSVADLGSENATTRRTAIDALKGEVGLDFGYDPAADEVQRQKASEKWRAYANALEVAIKEKVPKLIEKWTWQNKSPRALAAMHLGESAPHPAFLPLLRAVIGNQEEDQDTRIKALVAVSRIPHQGMIGFLIEQLDTDLAYWAWHKLDRLTRAGIQNDTDNWLDVKRKYVDWWKENKGTFVYERVRALMS